jgi:hypothetical protein
VRGTVVLLTDKDNNVVHFVGHDYEFQVPPSQAINTDKGTQYNRRLRLPKELVNGYRVQAGMGIELILREFVMEKEWLVEHIQKNKMGSFLENLEKKIGFYREIFPNISEAQKEMLRKEVEKPEKIFPEIDLIGVMDFRPKREGEELFATSEPLVITKFTDDFYDKLSLEINNSFRFGLPTATMVLVRKLFERLIIDLLRTKFGMSQKELFYSEIDSGFLSLSALIRNLKQKVDDFKPNNFFKLKKEKEDFENFLWKITEEGSPCAHSMHLLDREGINDLKPSINKYSELLIRLIQKVKETPK